MKEMLSNSEKIRKFIDLLIAKTEKNELVWETMPYEDYYKLADDINEKRMISRNNFNYHIQSAIQMSDKLAKAIANACCDMRVYYTNLNGVQIFLIEEVNYNYSLPQSTFELTIIKISNNEKDFKYTLEFANEKEKYELLAKLASYVTPLFDEIDDKAMAMDFIDSLIE